MTALADSRSFGGSRSFRGWGGERSSRPTASKRYSVDHGKLIPHGYPKEPIAPAPIAPREPFDEFSMRLRARVIAVEWLAFVESAELHTAQTAKSLELFKPSDDTVSEFLHAANGSGLNRVSMWLMNALYDSQDAQDLMAEAVEGGLLATFRFLRQGDQDRIAMQAVDETVLRQAIGRRIPRVHGQARETLANRLFDELKQTLGTGHSLMIDGATVFLQNGKLTAQINREDKEPAPVEDERDRLAA